MEGAVGGNGDPDSAVGRTGGPEQGQRERTRGKAWSRSSLTGILKKKGQLVVLVVGSCLTPHNSGCLRAYVSDGISKSGREFLKQEQKFLDECLRTGKLVNNTTSYSNCPMEELNNTIG